MIIALLALAFAMIVGGLLAAFFGWDIVLVERGWTMVIAGSIMAASGAVLLGIVAAVSRLAKIEARLAQLRDGLGEDALPGTRRAAPDLSLATLSGGVAAGTATAEADEGRRPDEAQPTLPLFEEESRDEAVKEEVKAAEWPQEPRVYEPVVPFPPRTSPSPAPSREEDEPDMKVPDFLLADRERDADEEPRVIDGADIHRRDPDERDRDERDLDTRDLDTRDLDTRDLDTRDLDARDLDERAPERRDLDEADKGPKPVVEIVPDLEPEPDREPAVAGDSDRENEPDDETASDETHPPVVVGTYNSGDNRYVMFSDGSIEAQTPSGVFRFKSLDELKEFIAAGGEGNASSST